MRRVVSTVAGLLAGTAATAAEPEPGTASLCLPRLELLAARLAAGWAERPVAAGIGADGSLLSTFAAPASGTWTLVVTRPGGPSCVVAAGSGFVLEPRHLGPEA